MLKKTRIALVSDLHIGTEAIASDLCPHQLDPSAEFGIETQFLKKFRDFAQSEEFAKNGPIDLLCVTGDISHRADPSEFEHADMVIKEVAGALGVSRDAVYFVPGNHDVHWPVMQLAPKPFWDKFRYEPLMQGSLIFRSRVDAAATGAYHQSPHFVVWTAPGQIVVGINSAAFDDPSPADGKHHGLVHQATLDALETFMRGVEYDPAILRICLLHHHPINYSDLRADFADFSAATNAGNLFELLSRHRFDLVFHGHKHIAHLKHGPNVSNGHPVTVLGAGSFSAKLGTRWCGLTQNQFHIVEISGRDSRTHAAFGHVSTWNFMSDGWRESNFQLGLCATEGFGTFATPAELDAEIEKHVDEILGNGDVAFLRWPQLESRMPSLAHVNTKAVFAAFERIAGRRGMEFSGDLNTKKHKWLLLASSEEA